VPDNTDFKTVLSIEDNISNYHLMDMIFQKRPGGRLLGAMQGSIGLELAHQHHPDLILLHMHYRIRQALKCYTR
jgi:response regulator RpfG family c-di-GMP phosphodiesterase